MQCPKFLLGLGAAGIGALQLLAVRKELFCSIYSHGPGVQVLQGRTPEFIQGFRAKYSPGRKRKGNIKRTNNICIGRLSRMANRAVKWGVSVFTDRLPGKLAIHVRIDETKSKIHHQRDYEYAC